jgi:hypothetical protein
MRAECESLTCCAEWRELEKTLIPNREDVKENTRKMKSDYASVASHVRPLAWVFEAKYLLFTLPDSLALMLLGIALFHRDELLKIPDQDHVARRGAAGQGEILAVPRPVKGEDTP